MVTRVRRFLMLVAFRGFIRRFFTRTVYVTDKVQSPRTVPVAVDGAQKSTRKRKRGRTAQVSPSERFVWGMATLIVALVGVLVLEVVCIVVTGAFNSELLAVISGLVGSLVTAFVMGKKT